MKNLDLMSYDVVEMNQQEMLTVEGGNIFVDAWNAVKSAAVAVAEVVVDVVVDIAARIWYTLSHLEGSGSSANTSVY